MTMRISKVQRYLFGAKKLRYSVFLPIKISRGDKEDRVMIFNDRDDNHKGNLCGLHDQCAAEIVKEILGQDWPASRLRGARQDSSASGKRKIRYNDSAGAPSSVEWSV